MHQALQQVIIVQHRYALCCNKMQCEISLACCTTLHSGLWQLCLQFQLLSQSSRSQAGFYLSVCTYVCHILCHCLSHGDAGPASTAQFFADLSCQEALLLQTQSSELVAAQRAYALERAAAYETTMSAYAAASNRDAADACQLAAQMDGTLSALGISITPAAAATYTVAAQVGAVLQAAGISLTAAAGNSLTPAQVSSLHFDALLTAAQTIMPITAGHPAACLWPGSFHEAASYKAALATASAAVDRIPSSNRLLATRFDALLAAAMHDSAETADDSDACYHTSMDATRTDAHSHRQTAACNGQAACTHSNHLMVTRARSHRQTPTAEGITAHSQAQTTARATASARHKVKQCKKCLVCKAGPIEAGFLHKDR